MNEIFLLLFQCIKKGNLSDCNNNRGISFVNVGLLKILPKTRKKPFLKKKYFFFFLNKANDREVKNEMTFGISKCTVTIIKNPRTLYTFKT